MPYINLYQEFKNIQYTVLNLLGFIPIGNKHRLSNPSSDILLVIIKVQVCAYLEEDDIIRYEDIYDRV